MDKRVSFSGQDLELDEIVETYDVLYKSLVNYRDVLLLSMKTRTTDIPEQFLGYTIDELVRYFAGQVAELDRTMCLNVIAATEAKLRKDYLQRGYNRPSDPQSRVLRAVYSVKGNRASLEEDILEAWKQAEPSARGAIGELKSVLGLRHWLAHGRYWVQKLGRNYDFFSVFAVCQTLQTKLPLLS